MTPQMLLLVLAGGMAGIRVAMAQPLGMGDAGGRSNGDAGALGSSEVLTTTEGVSALPMLGTMARTTATGIDRLTGQFFDIGEDIYGPFEAGFTSQQDNIIRQLGCADPSDGYLEGGIDTMTAESIVAFSCGIELPRYEGAEYISLLDECGGHTNDYHFHERLSCLYDDTVPGHSPQIGDMDGQLIYGKWENQVSLEIPLLDACGGHFGTTPDSPDVPVYHYHVQDAPPFIAGCKGPAIGTDGNEALVTLEQCRAAYPECGDDVISVTTEKGTFSYDLWCPCFDGEGSNVGDAPLPVFIDATSTGPTSEEPKTTTSISEQCIDLGCGCGKPAPSGCDHVCGSTAVQDECGVCGGSGIAPGACDCAGNIDLGCGCGVSGPSGCDHVCGSTAVQDECGVCGGDGLSCTTVPLSTAGRPRTKARGKGKRPRRQLMIRGRKVIF